MATKIKSIKQVKPGQVLVGVLGYRYTVARKVVRNRRPIVIFTDGSELDAHSLRARWSIATSTVVDR